MTDSDQPLTPEAAEMARRYLSQQAGPEREELVYFQKLFHSDDAFGVIIRGQVLIESYVERCLYAYVPTMTELGGKFFAIKVDLAIDLGIINHDEAKMLKAINKLRNDVAHNKKNKRGLPSFNVTPMVEQKLWSEFTTNPAMKGSNWPSYDATKFPMHLRLIMIHLIAYLGRREYVLARNSLPAKLECIALNDLDRDVMSGVAVALLEISTAIGDFESS